MQRTLTRVESGIYKAFQENNPSSFKIFLMIRDLTDSYIYFYLGDNPGTVHMGQDYRIGFTWYGGSLYYFDTNNDRVAIASGLKPNTWYEITIRNIDYSADTYDIYLDGELKMENAPFRSSEGNITHLQIDLDMWRTRTFYVDYIQSPVSDENRGHGNDPDGSDEENPGQGCDHKNDNGNKKRCST